MVTNNFLKALFFAVSFSVALPSIAQSVAYVDAQKLLEETPQGKTIVKNLESEFGERDRSLRAKSQAFREKQAGLERDILILPQDQIQKIRGELADTQIVLQREQRALSEDFARSRNRQMGQLEQNISATISRIAKEDGIDLVLQDVVYASDKIDITDRILQSLSQ